jgi:hypothetical protein
MHKTRNVALLVVIALLVAAAAFIGGRASVDTTLYCGAYTYKWDGRNGCELLPGYSAVPVEPIGA